MFLYYNQVARSTPYSKRLTYKGYLYTILYFLVPCPFFFYIVLIALAIRLRLVLPCPVLLYRLLVRGVLSSKRWRFVGSSLRDKVVVLRVNIVERAVEIHDSIVVIIYYSVTGIYSNSEGLEVIEAIQEVRH